MEMVNAAINTQKIIHLGQSITVAINAKQTQQLTKCMERGLIQQMWLVVGWEH